MAVEVTEQDFEAIVLEGSRQAPVVVDFWASWCAPCRSLGPMLERISEETGVTLAKVDIDANPGLAGAFGVRSIPMVLAFKDGRSVNEFVGAIPEQAVRDFFATLQPSQADRLAAQAEENEDTGEREALLRAALAADPGHEAAGTALAGILAESGAVDEARRVLGRLVPTQEVERALASLELAVARSGDITVLRAEAAARPDDAGALEALGRALGARGEHQEAMETLLMAVGMGSQGARRAMIDLFLVLGEDHELTRVYRPRLAAALF